jgi:hypothetical protein
MRVHYVKNDEYKKTRFMNKFHMVITDEDGALIKECKYPTAKDCSDDNIDLIHDRQVVLRIMNNYPFHKCFTKYNNIKINKISEVIPSVIHRRVLIEPVSVA